MLFENNNIYAFNKNVFFFFGKIQTLKAVFLLDWGGKST